MSSWTILCKFPLWVNYQTGIMYFDEENPYGLSLDNPEWPRSRRWKHCLGEVAIFKFAEKCLKKEVCQVVRNSGFMMGDLWCLSSFLREQLSSRSKDIGLNDLSCIVSPIRSIRGKGLPFIIEYDGKTLIWFGAECDWEGYWHQRWKFLTIRWLGEVVDDFWTSRYRSESTLINKNSLVFGD